MKLKIYTQTCPPEAEFAENYAEITENINLQFVSEQTIIIFILQADFEMRAFCNTIHIKSTSK